jgi:Domain of unknown function (DUF4440)
MKKNILMLGCFLITMSLFGQTPEQIVERLERQRFEAQVKKDTAFLEKIFANDLVYIHSGGKKDDKTSYLQSIKNGKSVYDKIDVEEIKVRMYGNQKVAVVNGMITIINANAAPTHLRYLVVYSKNGKNGWQLNSWQSLKLAQ